MRLAATRCLRRLSVSAARRTPGSCLRSARRCSSSMARSRFAPGSSLSGAAGTSCLPATMPPTRRVISSGSASPSVPDVQTSTRSPRGRLSRQTTPASSGSRDAWMPICSRSRSAVSYSCSTASSCCACSHRSWAVLWNLVGRLAARGAVVSRTTGLPSISATSAHSIRGVRSVRLPRPGHRRVRRERPAPCGGVRGADRASRSRSGSSRATSTSRTGSTTCSMASGC